MKSMNIVKIVMILNILSFAICYNSSKLKHVTAQSLANYSRENGYEGCYALYDNGANDTETCTQFHLEFPYLRCKVHYEIGDFKNDFCMPIANNTKALSDVEYAFRNAENVEIDCFSTIFGFSLKLFLIYFILII